MAGGWKGIWMSSEVSPSESFDHRIFFVKIYIRRAHFFFYFIKFLSVLRLCECSWQWYRSSLSAGYHITGISFTPTRISQWPFRATYHTFTWLSTGWLCLMLWSIPSSITGWIRGTKIIYLVNSRLFIILLIIAWNKRLSLITDNFLCKFSIINRYDLM